MLVSHDGSKMLDVESVQVREPYWRLLCDQLGIRWGHAREQRTLNLNGCDFFHDRARLCASKCGGASTSLFLSLFPDQLHLSTGVTNVTNCYRISIENE